MARKTSSYDDFKNNKDYCSNNEIAKIKHVNELHFLLCETCFWCASCIDTEKIGTTRCTYCNNNTLESMSVSDNENSRSYLVDL